jgi:hypothetical protein
VPERFRRRAKGGVDAAPEARGATPPRLLRRAPSPGALRRERREIMKVREEMIRDLGGLALEMYRRDQFREDLLAEQARDVVNLELRLNELDSMLAAAAAGRRASASRCACGAPIIWGSHFCANCGRPVGEAPVVACARCGHPLAADAEFCPGCGNEAEIPTEEDAVREVVEEAYERAAENGEAEATVVRAAAEQRADPWE